MSITIRAAKEILKLLKTKTKFSVKFAGIPKEVILTKKISLAERGRFGGTNIVFQGSDGMHYLVRDMQSSVKGIGPNTPSEGTNTIFSIIQLESAKQLSLSVKRNPKKTELPVWLTPQNATKEEKETVKTLHRSEERKICLIEQINNQNQEKK